MPSESIKYTEESRILQDLGPKGVFNNRMTMLKVTESKLNKWNFIKLKVCVCKRDMS